MDFLRSNGIKLRPIESTDLDFLWHVENDSKEWMQSENYLPLSKSVMEKYVSGEQDLIKHGQYRFIIEKEDTKERLGCIDLFDYQPVSSRSGVGIYIADMHRNNGIAKQSLRILCAYSKAVLNIQLLHCSILESNKKSQAVFMSQGFIVTGERPNWTTVNGKRCTIKLLQLLL